MSFPEAICAAASAAASAIEAKAIVAFSESGPTARLLSKQRPAAPIIAFTPFEPVRQRMALYWGVIPHTMPVIVETDKRISEVERRLKGEGLVEKGQRIVAEYGFRPVQPDVAAPRGALPLPLKLFTMNDLGGWAKIEDELYGPKGLWTSIFTANTTAQAAGR